MYDRNLYDHKALFLQIGRQKKYAWDLETGIDWNLGVDPKKFLLPMDNDNIAFPGADQKQQLALSQLLGLIINSTIAEMEDVITKLKDTAWKQVLRSYPVGPEMWELGQLFFEEEAKHSLAFSRYIDVFCKQMGIRRETLDLILPKAYGSLFLKAITTNAKMGGHAFWWVVGAVEEVSIELYKEIHKHKDKIDPLYYDVHVKHMEEESRHHNYAFLMLDLIDKRRMNWQRYLHKKMDLLFAQACSTGWIIAELGKVFEAKKYKDEHPFFETIASCEPLFKNLSWPELAKRLFISAPYISLVLNTKNHKLTTWTAEKLGTFSFPFPTPRDIETFSEPSNITHLDEFKGRTTRKKKLNGRSHSKKRV